MSAPEEIQNENRGNGFTRKPRDSTLKAGRDGDPAEIDDQSPIEEVALTVATTDDPTMPVWTFRMWFLGMMACLVLAFLNQFFHYRTEPLTISAVSAQIVALPLGKLMAATLPSTKYFKGSGFEFTLNPGPFNMKEHVLITIFANAGAGGAYAIHIVTIVKAIYRRHIDFFVGFLIIITTQILGYGWAGLYRNFLVKPAEMWWPSVLVQVSLFRTLHEEDIRPKGGLTRTQFFTIVLIVSFAYYILPGYLFYMLSSLSWVCWAWPNSVRAHQLGSGLRGLGIGAIGLDWSTVSSYLGSPLATPWFAIANIGVGFGILMYVITPIAYFSNVYNAKSFPIFSTHLFRSNGQPYNTEVVIDDKFSLDLAKYESYGRLHMSTFFAMGYGMGFAALSSTLSHVLLFHGKEIWRQSTSAFGDEKGDVHARLMKAYKEVPQTWFLGLLAGCIALSIAACEGYKSQLQLPWWGVLLACALAIFFTLPLGIIAATTNQLPGLNIITEYIIGYIYPGRPVANVCFKTYGYISMTQAVGFLSDFKLGHYMKIPPISMFIVQVWGTLIAAVVYLATAWWLLESVENICDSDRLAANSPWTCPGDRVFFDASVIWGLVGPKRIFGDLGLYKLMNWWFAIGALAPVPGWICTKIWPEKRIFHLINMPVLIGATGSMPPATAVNFTSWIVVGFIFNCLIFKHHKALWSRYNYVLSAALDAGTAFMGVAIYFFLELEKKDMSWWGSNLDNCPLAKCPTAEGVIVNGCPIP